MTPSLEFPSSILKRKMFSTTVIAIGLLNTFHALKLRPSIYYDTVDCVGNVEGPSRQSHIVMVRGSAAAGESVGYYCSIEVRASAHREIGIRRIDGPYECCTPIVCNRRVARQTPIS